MTTLKLNNGDRVKDPISGFSGIVTCRLEYLNGCTRIQVNSEKLDAGRPIDSQYFDEPQLVLVKKNVHGGVNNTGGFQAAPQARSTDKR